MAMCPWARCLFPSSSWWLCHVCLNVLLPLMSVLVPWRPPFFRIYAGNFTKTSSTDVAATDKKVSTAATYQLRLLYSILNQNYFCCSITLSRSSCLWSCWLWMCDCSHLHPLNTCCYTSTDIVLSISVIASFTVTFTPYYCTVIACSLPSVLPLFWSLSSPLSAPSHPQPLHTLFSLVGLLPSIESQDPLEISAFWETVFPHHCRLIACS